MCRAHGYGQAPAKQLGAVAVSRRVGLRDLLISNIESFVKDDYCELSARIQTDSLNEPFQLWYRFPARQKDFIDAGSGDPFLAAALLPAMKIGEPLQVTSPVSHRLLDSARLIQSIYHDWDRTLSVVPISAPARRDENRMFPKLSHVGLFMSLGVDSFHLLLRNLTARPATRDEITHLIFLHGFDISRDNYTVFEDLMTNGATVAETFGKKTLWAATNLRDFSDRFVDWGRLYHGAFLASVGLTLERMFKIIYIAGGHQPRHLHPWGSHPLLDPLWSTENLLFLSEGCETGRVEKLRFLTQFPIAMATLRVCFSNPNDEYNCGRCEKCVRTMIGLHIAGGLEKCKTFSDKIEIESVRDLTVTWIERAFIQDLLSNLTDSSFDRTLASALRYAIDQNKVESELRKIAARRVRGVVPSDDERFFDQNKNDEFHESMLALIKSDLERLDFSANGNILDLGCGCGTFVRVCRNKGLDAVGVDPSAELLAIAKRKEVGHFVLRAVGEFLPFKEKSFDIITSSSVLEHVHAPRLVLGESVRVLKPGGVLWLSFPDYSACFHEGHYDLFWIPLMPKQIAKLYVRLRGRTNTRYLDSIQYVTRRAVKRTLNTFDVRIIDMQRPAASEMLKRIRTYSMERIRSPEKIETKQWRRLLSFLRRVGFDDPTLCRICELYCLAQSFNARSFMRQFVVTRGNTIWVVERRS